LSVINLNQRLTTSWEDYNAQLKAPDSRIFVDGTGTVLDSPITLALTVGCNWLHGTDERFYAIPDEGIDVKPRDTVIVETAEDIGLPFNVFGLVTGKGTYIFRGLQVSSGKIDPGFRGKLRIGIYNGSNRPRRLQKAAVFACAFFMQTDLCLDEPLKSYESFTTTQAERAPWHQRLGDWLGLNWRSLIPIAVALGSLIVAVVGLAIKGGK
jgi:dUTPase